MADVSPIKKKKKKRLVSTAELPVAARAIFETCKTYRKVTQDFHQFHQHDINCALHLITSTLAVWGVVNVVFELMERGTYLMLIYTYMILVALTTPWKTALVHTALMNFCLQSSRPFDVAGYYVSGYFYAFEPWMVSFLTIMAGIGLQIGSHWLWGEPTFVGSYMKKGDNKEWMLIPHTFWLLPLAVDAVLKRNCFLQNLPSRNRNLETTVASKHSVDALRKWIQKKIKYSGEATVVRPRERKGALTPVTELENDKAINAALRTIFPAKHYDFHSLLDMNEIFVSAVGAKQPANADSVSYTPHTEGPLWFFPGVSLYCMQVGLTPNRQIRNRFVMQHSSQDTVLDKYGVIGFDYNRELQCIDQVPGKINIERRSVLKLHYIVYPTGWHRYGSWCAEAIVAYNIWAKDVMLKTVPTNKQFDSVVASIILTSIRLNAILEEHLGWSNLAYIGAAYALGGCDSMSWVFLILTSFRHYAVYTTTFAYRDPPVALGCLMRDAKVYKTISNIHLIRRLGPVVDFSRDWPGIFMTIACFAITLLACARLGMVRTYFGTELGFDQPKWIEGFPYGTIPHPMIMGQILGFGVILYWWRWELTIENATLLFAHIICYLLHMVQEILVCGRRASLLTVD